MSKQTYKSPRRPARTGPEIVSFECCGGQGGREARMEVYKEIRLPLKVGFGQPAYGGLVERLA